MTEKKAPTGSTIEEIVQNVIVDELKNGNAIETMVRNELQKSLQKVVAEMFGHFGKASRTIQDKLQSIILPAIESHDFNAFTLKLDTLLTQAINASELDQTEILKNMRKVLEPAPKEITLEELFDKYVEFVQDNVDVSELEVEVDEEPLYEMVEVTAQFDEDDDNNGRVDYAYITFRCKDDESLNKRVTLIRFRNLRGNKWEISRGADIVGIDSIRYATEFDMLLLNMQRKGTNIDLQGEDYLEDEVRPTKQPEPTFE